jgi:hypothetical protein
MGQSPRGELVWVPLGPSYSVNGRLWEACEERLTAEGTP